MRHRLCPFHIFFPPELGLKGYRRIRDSHEGVPEESTLKRSPMAEYDF
jgi:hypothetical protein